VSTNTLRGESVIPRVVQIVRTIVDSVVLLTIMMRCPATVPGENSECQGCSAAQLDSDGLMVLQMILIYVREHNPVLNVDPTAVSARPTDSAPSAAISWPGTTPNATNVIHCFIVGLHPPCRRRCHYFWCVFRNEFSQLRFSQS